MKLATVLRTVKAHTAALAVDMAVAARFHLVLPEQRQDLLAAVFEEDRRIVQKSQLFPLSGRRAS